MVAFIQYTESTVAISSPLGAATSCWRHAPYHTHMLVQIYISHCTYEHIYIGFAEKGDNMRKVNNIFNAPLTPKKMKMLSVHTKLLGRRLIQWAYTSFALMLDWDRHVYNIPISVCLHILYYTMYGHTGQERGNSWTSYRRVSMFGDDDGSTFQISFNIHESWVQSYTFLKWIEK